MPSSPKKHCPRGHEAYQGRRCPKCNEDYEEKRGNSNERGYDRIWRRFAKEYLKRNPICSDKNCLELATDVDHIKALRDGGDKFSYSNLRSFCHNHHSQRTMRENVKHKAFRNEIVKG